MYLMTPACMGRVDLATEVGSNLRMFVVVEATGRERVRSRKGGMMVLGNTFVLTKLFNKKRQIRCVKKNLRKHITDKMVEGWYLNLQLHSGDTFGQEFSCPQLRCCHQRSE